MSQFPPQSPHPPMPPQPQAPRPEAPGATTGLVLGICAIVFNFPVVGLVLAIIGFNKSKAAKELCEAAPGAYEGYGVAKAGYICSIIGICLGCLSLVCGCGYFAMIALAIGGGAMGP